MPCYNEQEVVGATITGLFEAFDQACYKLELVAVDNGSTDRTSDILNRLAQSHHRLIVHRVDVNQGYGNGLLAGLPLTTAPWVGIICADGQVDAADVVRLFASALRLNTPKIIKVRRRFRTDGLIRKVTSVSYNLITTVLFGGLGSIDINGNPKILPRHCLEDMNLESRDWFLDAEMLIKAKQLGMDVLEVNVMAQMREGGSSNVSAATCWEFAKNLTRYRLGGVRRLSNETTLPKRPRAT